MLDLILVSFVVVLFLSLAFYPSSVTSFPPALLSNLCSGSMLPPGVSKSYCLELISLCG